MAAIQRIFFIGVHAVRDKPSGSLGLRGCPSPGDRTLPRGPGSNDSTTSAFGDFLPAEAAPRWKGPRPVRKRAPPLRNRPPPRGV